MVGTISVILAVITIITSIVILTVIDNSTIIYCLCSDACTLCRVACLPGQLAILGL